MRHSCVQLQSVKPQHAQAREALLLPSTHPLHFVHRSGWPDVAMMAAFTAAMSCARPHWMHDAPAYVRGCNKYKYKY